MEEGTTHEAALLVCAELREPVLAGILDLRGASATAIGTLGDLPAGLFAAGDLVTGPRNVVEAVASGELPPKGTVIAGTKAVCDECPRERTEEKQVTEFKRIHLVENDPEKCLLEQGIMCCGPATRDGCEAAWGCTRRVRGPCRAARRAGRRRSRRGCRVQRGRGRRGRARRWGRYSS